MVDMQSFNLFKDLGTEESLETEGVWVWPYGPEEIDGTPTKNPAFKIRRMGGANLQYEKSYLAAIKPYRRMIQANIREPDEKTAKLLKDVAKRCFLDTCLLSWKSVYAADGVTEIEFSRAAALDLFTKVPQVFQDLQERAMELQTFRREDNEDDAGN